MTGDDHVGAPHMAGRINLADEHALRDWPARFGVDPFTLEAREK